ncbi:MAG: hypothetical protein U0599_14005 [Vicinamibacteria bacterium]
MTDVLGGPARGARLFGAGARPGISYFARFGVTEGSCATRSAPRSRAAATSLDVFFQHKVGNTYVLEDGAVNCASPR